LLLVASITLQYLHSGLSERRTRQEQRNAREMLLQTAARTMFGTEALEAIYSGVRIAVFVKGNQMEYFVRLLATFSRETGGKCL